MEAQQLSCDWVNDLIASTKEYDNVKELSLSIRIEDGAYVLRLFQNGEAIHRATYPNEQTMNLSFPRTFLYILSRGIEKFNNQRL